MEVDYLKEVIIEVWGDLACFSMPVSKVERLSYPFPTPSAARGILSAIYMKPKEFYWQVNSIQVLRPIKYISFKRNEVKCTVNGKEYVFADDERTQRQTVALQDVRYRISASIVKHPSFTGTEEQLFEQAMRRIRNGKVYFQPSLGLREFVAYFDEYIPKPEEDMPIQESLDAGLMVYDIFDFTQEEKKIQKKTNPRLSLFHAKMENGIITIPPYQSPAVLKGGESC